MNRRQDDNLCRKHLTTECIQYRLESTRIQSRFGFIDWERTWKFRGRSDLACSPLKPGTATEILER